ncbi:unnamed protein product [Prunus armeniaca]
MTTAFTCDWDGILKLLIPSAFTATMTTAFTCDWDGILKLLIPSAFTGNSKVF